MFPAGDVLAKPVPPPTEAPTTRDPAVHICDTQVSKKVGLDLKSKILQLKFL